MKITQREKVLLTILVTIAIVVGGFILLIVPQNEIKETLRGDLSVLEQESIEMRTAISGKSLLETQLVEAGVKITDTLDEISSPLANETFDHLVNKLSIKHHVIVTELSYSLPSVMKPEVQYGVPSELEYALKEELLKLNSEVVGNENVKTSEYDIIKKTIMISVDGSSDNVKQFVDGLYTGGHQTIYITNLTMDYEAETAKVILDLFSIDKLKIE